MGEIVSGVPAAWRDLVGRATVGTAREGGAGAAAALLAKTILDGAAMEGAAAKAGFAGMAAGPEPAPECPPETRPVVERGAEHLGRCLELGDDLVQEWLRLAEEARVLAPPALLPRLTEWALKDATGQRWMRLRPAIGHRGEWLLRLKPAWAPLTANIAEEPEESWTTGSLRRRQRILNHIRREDPARAREMFEGVLDEEDSKARATLLQALRPRLGPEDEPLLTRLLDDRSEEVRARALHYLSLIPNSQVGRDSERVLFGLAGFHRDVLRVDLPEPDADPWLKRLAAIATSRIGSFGAREALLVRLMCLVRPERWQEEFGLGPEAFLGHAAKSDYWRPLSLGIGKAAVRFSSEEWLSGLTSYVLSGGDLEEADLVAGALPPERLESLAIRHGAQGLSAFRSAVLRRLPFWGPELSRLELDRLARFLNQTAPESGGGTKYALEPGVLAAKLAPETFDQAAALLEQDAANRLEVWRSILPLRRAMRETIMEAAGR